MVCGADGLRSAHFCATEIKAHATLRNRSARDNINNTEPEMISCQPIHITMRRTSLTMQH